MSILIGFLYFVEVVVCLLLALVVMLQKPKEGGLGGAIGGGMLEASLGADAGNVLIRTTAVLGAIFLLNTLVLARLTSTLHSHSIVAQSEESVVNETPAATPQPAAAPELSPDAGAAPDLAPAPVVVPTPASSAPVAAPAPVAPAAAPAAPAAPAPAPAAPAPAAPAAPAPAAAPAQSTK